MPPSSNFPNNDLNKINSVPTPAPQVSTPPPPPPPQFKPQPQPQPQPQTFVPPAMPQQTGNIAMRDVPSSGPKHTKLIVFIILVVILIGGGVALAATGIIDIPIPFLSKAPYDKNHVVRDIAKGFSSIQGASYTTDIGLHTKPKDADAEIIPGSPIDNGSTVPEKIDVTGKITGASQKSVSDINGKVALDFKIAAGDFSMDLAAEMRKVNSDFYLIFTKFPSLIPGLESIRDKWVKISQADITVQGAEIDTASIVDFYKQYEENNKTALEQVKIFLDVADKDQLLTVKGSPVKEKVGDVTAYRYDLQINQKALPAVYKDFTTAMKAKYGDKSPVVFNESSLADLEDEKNIKVFEYIQKNVPISIWADSKGIPIKYSIGMRYLPNTKVPSKTQVNADVSVTLTNINKTVVIDAPAGAMGFDEAYTLVTGETKEMRASKGKDSAIKALVSSMRAQAEIYYFSNNDSYSNLCKSGIINTSINNAVADIAKFILEQKNVKTQKEAGIVCQSSKDAYVISVSLITPKKSFCIDSNGAVGEGTLDKAKNTCKIDLFDSGGTDNLVIPEIPTI